MKSPISCEAFVFWSKSAAQASRRAARLVAAAAFFFALASVLPMPVARAAITSNWTGTTGNWTDGTWSNGVPGASATTTTGNGDTAVFNANSGTITVDALRNIANITFDTNAGAFTLSGGSFYLTSGGTTQITSGFSGTGITEAINTAITLEGNYTFSNNKTVASDVLDFGGNIADAANGTLNLNGVANTGLNTISGVIGNGAGTHRV